MASKLVNKEFAHNIRMHLDSCSMEEALRLAAELMQENHYVRDGYGQSMLERECEHSTYLDYGIAIPHGTEDSQNLILKSGIVILHFDEAVLFRRHEEVHFLIAIACKEEDDIQVLLQISDILSKDDLRNKFLNSSIPQDLLDVINENYAIEGGI